MAITKMKTVIISGPVSQFDSIAEKYVYGRDIHLENAMSHLANRRSLSAFADSNDYEAVVKNALAAMERIGCEAGETVACEDMSLEEMQLFLDGINRRIDKEKNLYDGYAEELDTNKKTIERMEKISGLNADVSRLSSLEFIKCKFGHIPRANYKTLVTYLDGINAIFVETAQTASDIWGLYFVPASEEQRTGEIFRSLYFEEKRLPETFTGDPDTVIKQLRERNEELGAILAEADKKIKEFLSDEIHKLQAVYSLAKRRSQLSEIKRNSARGVKLFYIIGFMSESDARSLEKEIDTAKGGVMMYTEDPENSIDIPPPTKLKNNPVFRPFEMFVNMYGLPSYNEIDPTPILAVTYMLFFGIMFGDVGQSAIFAIVGFILYKIKKIKLAGIVGWVGVSGVIFGFIYGSFFGNEELIPELLHTTPIHPMEQAIMMLGATIAMGVVIIIFGIILNIINSFKAGQKGEAVFGHNGMAGLVFYLSFLFLAANIFLKWGIPNKVFGIIIIIAVAAMYMCVPLSELIAGKKHWLPKDGMFYVENLFEMFEVVLSFFTNTISFLRIGAFAIVHVGMMMVVSILTPAGVGLASILVMVIGNAVVMILEGLIVGIQVLRLEYYEMFSRYFTGRGRGFVSLSDK